MRRIEQVIKEEINPVLEQHEGGVELKEFKDGVAKVRLVGKCMGCGSAQDTFEGVVRDIILQECDDVKEVILDTSVDPELLDMARRILNGEA